MTSWQAADRRQPSSAIQLALSVALVKPSQPKPSGLPAASVGEVSKQSLRAVASSSHLVHDARMSWQLLSQVPAAGGSQVSSGSMMPSPQTSSPCWPAIPPPPEPAMPPVPPVPPVPPLPDVVGPTPHWDVQELSMSHVRRSIAIPTGNDGSNSELTGFEEVVALLEAATNCAAQTPDQLVRLRQAFLVMLAVAESQRQGVASSKPTPDSP